MAEGRMLAPGRAEAAALVLDAPLSFWGGVETETGRIKDVHHPQHDRHVAGRVLVLRSGRGSSSSSSVLAETIRLGTGPAAIILAEPDPILALASIVASELYGTAVPVVVLPEAAYIAISDGTRLRVLAPSTNASARALVEVGGVEPPSPDDRSGLLRAQPTVDLVSGLPSAEDPSTSPGSMSDRGPQAEPRP